MANVRMIEDAAMVFLNAKAWPAAIGVFSTLVQANPQNPDGWFGMGSALWRMAFNDVPTLTLALSVIKRAMDTNTQKDDKNYKFLLTSISEQAVKLGIVPEDVAAFAGDDPQSILDLIHFTPQMLVDAARALEWDKRAKLVSYLGELPFEMFTPLLEDVATNETNFMLKKSAQKAVDQRAEVMRRAKSSEATQHANLRGAALQAQIEREVGILSKPPAEVIADIQREQRERRANAEQTPAVAKPDSTQAPVTVAQDTAQPAVATPQDTTQADIATPSDTEPPQIISVTETTTSVAPTPVAPTPVAPTPVDETTDTTAQPPRMTSAQVDTAVEQAVEGDLIQKQLEERLKRLNKA
jgi:hypothetical protein